MKMEQSFEVRAPVDRVWDALIDLERVAPCLPGAAITGKDDEGAYAGTFQVKLGPTTASYRGSVLMENLDADTYTATMRAKGVDKRGQGGATATIVNRLSEIPGGTRVDSVTDFAITGKLARFGRGGMIQDVSNRLLGDFATCLQQSLAAQPAAATSAPASANAEPGTVGLLEPDTTPPVEAFKPAPAKPIGGFGLVVSVTVDRILGALGAERLRRLARRFDRIASRSN
jgi:uncharacterized protein